MWWFPALISLAKLPFLKTVAFIVGEKNPAKQTSVCMHQVGLNWI